MTDRKPHPSAHTHGDDFAHDLLDRVLTEVEGMRDEFIDEIRGLRSDLAAARPKPVELEIEPGPAPAEPVAVDITEPATAPAAKPPVKKTAAKRQPIKEVPGGTD